MKRQPPRVRLELTPHEARMLDFLAGDLMMDSAEFRAVHGKRDFDAACRACAKLSVALVPFR